MGPLSTATISLVKCIDKATWGPRAGQQGLSWPQLVTKLGICWFQDPSEGAYKKHVQKDTQHIDGKHSLELNFWVCKFTYSKIQLKRMFSIYVLGVFLDMFFVCPFGGVLEPTYSQLRDKLGPTQALLAGSWAPSRFVNALHQRNGRGAQRSHSLPGLS